ncbi:hypothetical protein ACFSCX_12920 [Bacillus salitolerans]|uniref:Uncharacterized protein n=1 Tax=Bacillus salitolerans TaxID=1437434 RepID=A0ABW4LSG1_9BACI
MEYNVTGTSTTKEEILSASDVDTIFPQGVFYRNGLRIKSGAKQDYGTISVEKSFSTTEYDGDCKYTIETSVSVKYKDGTTDTDSNIRILYIDTIISN